MLTSKQIEKLKANWGPKAESMEAMAEVRIYNTLPSWECFVYAMNPDDEDEIRCIFNDVIYETYSLDTLKHIFNRDGEYPKIDHEYRPRMASEIYKKMRVQSE